MPHSRERRELVVVAGEVEVTRYTYDTNRVTATPMSEDVTISREVYLHELQRIEVFRDTIKEDFGPIIIPRLSFEKQEFVAIPTGLKGELRVGEPNQIVSELEYNISTGNVLVSARPAFDVCWLQWEYWINWLREFHKLLGIFE